VINYVDMISANALTMFTEQETRHSRDLTERNLRPTDYMLYIYHLTIA